MTAAEQVEKLIDRNVPAFLDAHGFVRVEHGTIEVDASGRWVWQTRQGNEVMHRGGRLG